MSQNANTASLAFSETYKTANITLLELTEDLLKELVSEGRYGLEWHLFRTICVKLALTTCIDSSLKVQRLRRLYCARQKPLL
jgi:hypothetical protein